MVRAFAIAMLSILILSTAALGQHQGTPQQQSACPYRQNFNLTWRADLFECLILSAMLLHRKIGPTVQSTIYTNRLISSLSVAAIDNAFVSAHGLPSHNLIAIDLDLVVNSRGVSMIVAQEPAQPLATLYSFITTSFRDLRKQQDIGLPLMISLSVIVHNVFAHRSS